MTASIVVLLVVAGVFPVAASAGLVKGLVDPPAWSEGEAVQFVPAPLGWRRVRLLRRRSRRVVVKSR